MILKKTHPSPNGLFLRWSPCFATLPFACKLVSRTVYERPCRLTTSLATVYKIKCVFARVHMCVRVRVRTRVCMCVIAHVGNGREASRKSTTPPPQPSPLPSPLTSLPSSTASHIANTIITTINFTFGASNPNDQGIPFRRKVQNGAQFQTFLPWGEMACFEALKGSKILKISARRGRGE